MYNIAKGILNDFHICTCAISVYSGLAGNGREITFRFISVWEETPNFVLFRFGHIKVHKCTCRGRR